MPSASQRQFIELAVNMPEQEPQVGQALCSSFVQILGRDLAGLQFPHPFEHGDQVGLLHGGLEVRRQVAFGSLLGHAGRHRPAADKDRRNVQAHGGHEHAGHNLVAVRNADHAVKAMRADHGLDAVGDQLARGQRILHAAVAHGDAVVHADGVEDERHTARLANEAFDQHADLVEVGVAGDAIGVGVADGDKRLVPVRLGFDGAGSPQQRAVRGAFKAFLDNVRAHSFQIQVVTIRGLTAGAS